MKSREQIAIGALTDEATITKIMRSHIDAAQRGLNLYGCIEHTLRSVVCPAIAALTPPAAQGSIEARAKQFEEILVTMCTGEHNTTEIAQALAAAALPKPAAQGSIDTADRALNLYDEIECDLPHLFGRASKEGHDTGQVLAKQVRAKMHEARAHIAQRAASADEAPNRAEFINRIVLSIAEIPDRDSPEDQPEMMLVTADELRGIIASAFEAEDERTPAAPVAGDHHAQVAQVVRDAVKILDKLRPAPIADVAGLINIGSMMYQGRTVTDWAITCKGLLAKQAATNAEAARWCRENGFNVPPQWDGRPVDGYQNDSHSAEHIEAVLGKAAPVAGDLPPLPKPDLHLEEDWRGEYRYWDHDSMTAYVLADRAARQAAAKLKAGQEQWELNNPRAAGHAEPVARPCSLRGGKCSCPTACQLDIESATAHKLVFVGLAPAQPVPLDQSDLAAVKATVDAMMTVDANRALRLDRRLKDVPVEVERRTGVDRRAGSRS